MLLGPKMGALGNELGNRVNIIVDLVGFRVGAVGLIDRLNFLLLLLEKKHHHQVLLCLLISGIVDVVSNLIFFLGTTSRSA